MMKPVHLTTTATPIDGMPASTQVESVMEQEELKRINRQHPVNGFVFITRNDKKRLLELLSVAKSMDFRERLDINGLAVKLKSAYVVDAREVAGDIITMNSRTELG